MKHLGDVTKISGRTAPAVDCIIGGSPCQDLSIAGRRAGLAGERSGLFMEQVRIVKEMREADQRRGRAGNAIRPRFMVWENVPGAFSSNKGQDFRSVLEEIIRIAEPDAPDVPLPKKWPLADCWYGDGWSVAYRVLDAQFWGVPQRRRRIALVADFGGHAAPEILFVRKGVCRDIAESGMPREEAAARVGGGASETIFCIQGNCIDRADTAGCNGRGWTKDISYTLNTIDRPAVAYSFDILASNSMKSKNPNSGCREVEIAKTLDTSSPDPSKNQGGIAILQRVCEAAVYDARGNGDGKTVCTLTGDHQSRVTDYTAIVMSTGQAAAEITHGIAPTLNCDHEQPIIAHTLRSQAQDPHAYDLATYIKAQGSVRRLTPLECERLQGYPDGWTDIGPWTDSKGKLHKESSDSARYKALGNSIALPPWKWVLKRLCACYERDATMASLFDGIGGFPLIWERLNGPGSCLWASEIEEFPIAVTKARWRI